MANLLQSLPVCVLLCSEGSGVVVAKTETGIKHIRGGEVLQGILYWVKEHLGDQQRNVHQYKLLALVAAMMIVPDLLHDRYVTFLVIRIHHPFGRGLLFLPRLGGALQRTSTPSGRPPRTHIFPASPVKS